MDWIKKQITLAQQNIASAGDNSSVESETNPMNNKGILIMYCHLIKDEFKIQKNLHLDFYSGQVYFTKGNRLVKSFMCSEIISVVQSNDLLTIQYRKKYQMSNRQKSLQFSSSFEAIQIRNHFKFIGENGQILRDLFIKIDREFADEITATDLKYAFRMFDIDVSNDTCSLICSRIANPKEIITTHLVDSEDRFDYIQFFHTFYKIWMSHKERYAPRSYRECLLNWMYYHEHTAAAEGAGAEDGSATDDHKENALEYSALALVAGETLNKIFDHVTWVLGRSKSALSFSGRMTVTDYRVVLEVGPESREPGARHSRFHIPAYFNSLTVPLHSLLRAYTEGSTLQLQVKDTRQLAISSTSSGGKKSFAEEALLLIHRFAFPGSMRQLKLFSFRCTDAESNKTSWTLTDLVQDYRRMKIDYCPEWRLFDNSADWKLCDSYPPHLIVPARIKNSTLLAVAEHRSKGRLPVVTYRHAVDGNGAVLLRSAQPLVGLTQKASPEDEFLMECFRMRERPLDQTGAFIGPKLYILDLRRQIAAAVNMAAGKGTEDISAYTNAELIFCNIENIHVMRTSLSCLGDAIAAGAEGDLSFGSKVEESGWLRHLSLLLAASVLAAEKLHLEAATVLCHCSDGFDRTSQMCALTQLMLDPYYRTIEGFAVLIEKDWGAFGHKFKDRCGHGLDYNVAGDERSPIFLQFLDAVFQMTIQFPSAFEFTSQLLVFLADHCTSGLFGNFIGNSYRQRHNELNVQDNTKNVWAVVFQRKEVFLDARYTLCPHPIWPASSLKKLILWERYFLRWDPTCHPSGIDGEWKDMWDDLF